MSQREELARRAARAAAEFRQEQGYSRTAPLCPLDAATKVGLQFWLMPIPSLEGMYCKDRGPSIIISTERPPGRQIFTAAHELGHHIFEHGTRSDEYLDTPPATATFDLDEFLADMFSAHLLMPPSAVRQAFSARQLTPSAATPLQVYAISTWLGVGYETLITHMERTLRILPSRQADTLCRESPKGLRVSLLGANEVPHLVIADEHWNSRTIDLRTGDGVLLPSDCVHEGGRLTMERNLTAGQFAIAAARGLGRVESPSTGWSCYVRVMPREYEGLSRFRFDEDPDEDVSTSTHLRE